MLQLDDWLKVVRNTPLISIDLLLFNSKGEVLVGWRNNRPAQNTWFVPGGVVWKDECLQDAFARIIRNELGETIPVIPNRASCFEGVFEHHYPDNVANQEGFGTHYVVLAHKLSLSDLGLENELELQLPKAQHQAYEWMLPEVAAHHSNVHAHTQAYFNTNFLRL